MRSRYGDDVNSNWGWARRRKKKNPVEQLPKWWPVSSSGSDQEEYQRMANRLILSLQICFPAILDNRMTGRDILVDDIIQVSMLMASLFSLSLFLYKCELFAFLFSSLLLFTVPFIFKEFVTRPFCSKKPLELANLQLYIYINIWECELHFMKGNVKNEGTTLSKSINNVTLNTTFLVPPFYFPFELFVVGEISRYSLCIHNRMSCYDGLHGCRFSNQVKDFIHNDKATPWLL